MRKLPTIITAVIMTALFTGCETPPPEEEPGLIEIIGKDVMNTAFNTVSQDIIKYVEDKTKELKEKVNNDKLLRYQQSGNE